MINAPDSLMTPRDLAALARVELNTVYRWRTRGYGPPALKVGRTVRYRREDVEAWIDEQASKEAACRAQ